MGQDPADDNPVGGTTKSSGIQPTCICKPMAKVKEALTSGGTLS